MSIEHSAGQAADPLDWLEYAHKTNNELLTQLFVGAPIAHLMRHLSDEELSSVVSYSQDTTTSIIEDLGETEAAWAKPEAIHDDIHAQRFLEIVLQREAARRSRNRRVRSLLSIAALRKA